jgi:TrmH family RNA methyltransferase
MHDEIISSVRNPRVLAATKLRDRRGRDRSGDIVIDGRREIARALDAGVTIREMFFCRAMLTDRDEASLLEPARHDGARMTEVTDQVFARISYGDRAEGVVAVARRPACALSTLEPAANAPVGVVEGIEKPGNLGAILRSADGAGVGAVVVADSRTDLYGPNVIRSSLGTIFCVPVAEASTAETIAWLRGRGASIVAASPAGDMAYTDVDMTGPVALVFGSEARGLSDHWRQADIIQASVPMHGRADSLNTSATAALFFFEALRQRSA